MLRIMGILYRNRFDGVLIPDHSPQMTCTAPWHAGMAQTLGVMKAAIMALERGFDPESNLAKTRQCAKQRAQD